MKNFLAVDTCGKHLAVLARKGEKTSRFFLPDCAMRHSVLLMDGIDEALRPELLDISSAIRNRLTLARMRRVLDFEG